MILKQLYLPCLSQASYLIADEESKTAVVVDPRRDVAEYLAEAKRLKAKIKHVLLTHFHADFASGHLELKAKTGATIGLGAAAKAAFKFRPLREGEPLTVGATRLDFLETPGHTPESISIVVYDLKKSSDKPQAVLTGDTLFVGDVGRPDLMASSGVTAQELAGKLYDSLHQKLLKLPDATVVYPAHGAGSLCGKSLGAENFSTIGEQKRTNYALKHMSREEFVRMAASDLPEAPAYFEKDAAFNRARHATLDTALRKAKALTLERVLRLQKGGAIVLDARSPAEWAAGHLKKSLNVGLDGRFASWVGAVVAFGARLVLVAPKGREKEAALRLGRVGYDGVLGWLKGGANAWAKRPELLSRLERVTPQELDREIASRTPPLVLDIRTPGERRAAAIAGSRFIPLLQLPRRLAEVPRSGRLILQCGSGYRSTIAASLLERAGRTAPMADLEGGMAAWQEAGLKTTTA